ncbi:hypothetical protein AMTR_s00040p00154980 [Amborella trichopoda]|uniref:Uncharacterized protein n=1 Tax=Amborella trichopoda TaxID=13333 RepID=W1PYM8_AMBTC|nr:hypothetical protein AMTR_s00040p00154980 [Amborella trichopoda]
MVPWSQIVKEALPAISLRVVTLMILEFALATDRRGERGIILETLIVEFSFAIGRFVILIGILQFALFIILFFIYGNTRKEIRDNKEDEENP